MLGHAANESFGRARARFPSILSGLRHGQINASEIRQRERETTAAPSTEFSALYCDVSASASVRARARAHGLRFTAQLPVTEAYYENLPAPFYDDGFMGGKYVADRRIIFCPLPRESTIAFVVRAVRFHEAMRTRVRGGTRIPQNFISRSCMKFSLISIHSRCDRG